MNKPWKAWEIRVLQEGYKRHGAETVKQYLPGRSIKSIDYKARQLGLKKTGRTIERDGTALQRLDGLRFHNCLDVRKARLAAGLSQEEVARRAGYRSSTLSHLETHGNARVQTVMDLLEVCGFELRLHRRQ